MLDLKWGNDESAGAKIIHQLRDKAPEVKIIVISAYPQVEKEAISAGAVMFLNKDISGNDLIKTIHILHTPSAE